MRRMFSFILGGRKRKAVVGILTLVLAATAAWAAWTVIVTNGKSKSGLATLTMPVVAEATVAPHDLTPNSAAFTGSQAIKVTNGNTAQLFITSYTPGDPADSAWTISGALDPPNCTVALLRPHLTQAGVINLAPGSGIPVNGSGTNGGVTDNVSLPGSLKADNTTPNACQGASINNYPLPNVVFSTAP